MELDALRIVTLVGRHGSFASVARVLDMDPSSVSRIVAQVEGQLGLRLFHRSTRRLSVTEEGAGYLARITPLLEEFDRARDEAHAAAHRPSGKLTMTTSVSFAHVCVVPHLKEFTTRYPDITLELLPTDANVDIVAETIDLAVRLAPAPKGDLISTRLRTTRYVVCAAPDFLAKHPHIATPEDLRHHACLRFALPGFRTLWRFRDGAGVVTEVPISGALVMSNAISLRSAARDGLGPALLPDWLVNGDLQSGALVNVLPTYDCAAQEFDTAAWALYPSRAYLPQKVRVMIDFLRDKLRTAHASPLNGSPE